MRAFGRIGFVLLLAGGASASAQASNNFTLLTQDRTISAFASADDFLLKEFDSDSDSAMAPDAGPFNTGASAQAEVSTALGTGGGTQDSTILIDGINASGSAFATGESFDFDGSAEGSGQSECKITFSVGADSTFTLTGEISATDNGIAEVALVNLSTGLVFDAFAFGPAEVVPINESGPLPSGNYELRFRAEGSAFGSGFSSEFAFAEYFEMQFRVLNCVGRGDLDGDGVVGASDLAILIGLWGSPGCLGAIPCPADLDKDGVVGSSDLSTLIGSWGLCP